VVPVKFTLALNGSATCVLPPAQIAVYRVSGSTNQLVDESLYVMAADDGSNFRVDGCQYVYNAAVSSFGPGSYVVAILVNGTTIGSANFGLK
jgi:hypothetical protein